MAKNILGWIREKGYNKSGEELIYKSTLTPRTISIEKVVTGYQLFIRNMYGTEELYKKFTSRTKAMQFATRYAKSHPNGVK